MGAYSQTEIEWAIERSAFTQKYCGDDCSNPPQLDFSRAIDLKDNISVDGKPLLLYKNPAPILRDKYLNDWFHFCVLADGGLFPCAGGALDQPTEFLDFYELYLSIKNIRKVQKEE